MQNWDGNGLWLVTPKELTELPDGIVLTCIDGSTAVKGKDYIDDDTRGGVLAYGIMNPMQHELKELFIEKFLKGNGTLT